jgi:hypothetical protein
MGFVARLVKHFQKTGQGGFRPSFSSNSGKLGGLPDITGEKFESRPDCHHINHDLTIK